MVTCTAPPIPLRTRCVPVSTVVSDPSASRIKAEPGVCDFTARLVGFKALINVVVPSAVAVGHAVDEVEGVACRICINTVLSCPCAVRVNTGGGVHDVSTGHVSVKASVGGVVPCAVAVKNAVGEVQERACGVVNDTAVV